MRASLAIEISEGAFDALTDQASALGKTPSELAANVVERVYGGDRTSVPDATAARLQFEQCFASVDLGRPIGIENTAIDADLARQYGASP